MNPPDSKDHTTLILGRKTEKTWAVHPPRNPFSLLQCLSTLICKKELTLDLDKSDFKSRAGDMVEW